MFKRLIFSGFLWVTIGLTSACAVNPVTGEQELSLISPAQEVAIGEQNYQPGLQSQGGLYMVDPQLTAYVSKIGKQLAAVSHRPGLPYEFTVLNNDVPNAWAMPGGKIAINRGLLIHLEDEAQLASVLGHEIVHVTARHAANQMTKSTLLGVGAQVAGIAAKDTDYGQLIMMGASVGSQAWMAKYGRDNELQSDAVGMQYMSDLGYDPQAAVELQQLFVRMSEGKQQDFISGLFASHPPSQARVNANQERAKNLPGNKRNQQAFLNATAQLRKDKEAYALHQQAIAAAQQKDFKQAMQLVDKAIAIQPRENHFHETRGHLFRVQEQPQPAIQAYSEAIKVNPGYYAPYLARGVVYQSSGNQAAAEKDLLMSENYLSTPIANYLLGNIYLQKGDRSKAVSYYKVAASAGGDVGKAATEELQKLGAIEAPATQK